MFVVDDERAGGDVFDMGFMGRGVCLAEERLEGCAEVQSSASCTALAREEGQCSLIKVRRSGIKEAMN